MTTLALCCTDNTCAPVPVRTSIPTVGSPGQRTTYCSRDCIPTPYRRCACVWGGRTSWDLRRVIERIDVKLQKAPDRSFGRSGRNAESEYLRCH